MGEKDYLLLYFTNQSLTLAAVLNGKVTKTEQAHFAKDAVKGSKIENTQEFQKTFENVLKKLRIKGVKSDFLSVIVPEEESFLKTTDFPANLPEDKILETIRWQAENLLPLASELVSFNFEVIESSKSNQSLLIFATPNEFIDQIIPIGESNNLLVSSFIPSSIFLAKLFESQSPSILVYQKDDETSDLVLTLKGLPYFATTTPSSSDEKNLGINSLLEFALIKLPKKKKPQTQKIKLNLLKQKIPPLPFIEPPSLAYSLEALLFNKSIKRWRLLFDFVLGTAILLLLLFWIFIYFQNLNVQASLKSAKSVQQSPAVLSTESEIEDLNKRLEILSTNLSSEVNRSYLLEELLKLNLANIQITGIGFNFEKSEGKITGTAGNRDSLIKFHQSLEQSNVFKNPDLPVSALTQAEFISFEITFKL